MKFLRLLFLSCCFFKRSWRFWRLWRETRGFWEKSWGKLKVFIRISQKPRFSRDNHTAKWEFFQKPDENTRFFWGLLKPCFKNLKKSRVRGGQKTACLVPFFGLSVGIRALKSWGGLAIFRSILRGSKKAIFGLFWTPKKPKGFLGIPKGIPKDLEGSSRIPQDPRRSWGILEDSPKKTPKSPKIPGESNLRRPRFR